MDRSARGTHERLLWAYVLTMLLVLATVTVSHAATIGGHLVHPRDDAAFRAVAVQVAGDQGQPGPQASARRRQVQAWARTHVGQVTAEGERACRWISTQPVAPEVDPTGWFAMSALARRYADQVPESSPMSAYGRSGVAIEAWSYLCWTMARNHRAPVVLARAD